MNEYSVMEEREQFDAQRVTTKGETMPSVNHSYICLHILRQLLANDEIEPFPELTLDIANGITPDISVFPKHTIKPNLLHDTPKCREKPVLAIEVVSASQTIQEMLQKAEQMTQAGVEMVWTVEPHSRSVFMTSNDEEMVIHEDVLERSGIRVDFAQVFGVPTAS